MAGILSHFTASASSSKLCLFCLGLADYCPEKSANGTDWTKTYFRQFLWKYLIGDDMVKINDFTANHLKNTVPPLCTSCHEKCLQLASFHVEFERIQDEVMQVSKDLLEGWKQRDTLLTQGEYDSAVQNIKPRAPSNRFIKSGYNSNPTVYPSYETFQMYQILRSPGHVRIPLSCLKSFGFNELKNLITKNSSVAKQILGVTGTASTSSLVAKAAVAAASAAVAGCSGANNSRVPKRYWINDVQVEMLGPSNNNDNVTEEEEEDEEEEFVQPIRKPPQIKISPIPSAKKRKQEVKVDPEVEYYDDEEAEEENNCLNFLEIVPNEQDYGEVEDEETFEDSGDGDNDEQQYYYDEENDEEMYEDENGDQEFSFESYANPNVSQSSNFLPSSFYIGRNDPSQLQQQKKRKRVFVLRKGNWTAEEDEMIAQIVNDGGPKNWSKVALQLGTGRTGKQIRERWTHHLNPEVNKNPWSEEEDMVLMQAHARWGNQWSRISKLLAGRTDNAVKNHWNGTLKRKAQMLQLRGE